jgi:probable F420-dependent oxidoreductase
MQYGTGLGLDWLGDFGVIRSTVERLDEAGFDYLTFGGRVLTSREGRFERPAPTYAGSYRDPFVLFSNLAATTSRIRFRTGIVILPLFPTVQVAKQSAELSLISGGRFDLGVGLSWNEPEYQAFGQDIHTRGRRIEEQMIVLKKLWTEEFVTFHGRFHDIDELGLGDRPAQPIPIWVGSMTTDPVLERTGRLADGWMPLFGLQNAEPIEKIRAAASAAGRTDVVDVAGRVTAHPDDPDATVAEARAQIALGVTALAIDRPPGAPMDEAITAIIAARSLLLEALGE